MGPLSDFHCDTESSPNLVYSLPFYLKQVLSLLPD